MLTIKLWLQTRKVKHLACHLAGLRARRAPAIVLLEWAYGLSEASRALASTAFALHPSLRG